MSISPVDKSVDELGNTPQDLGHGLGMSWG
jgi:hypothetical protein